MSKLSRYHLLISKAQSELEYKHNLGQTDKEYEHNKLITLDSLTAWIFLAEDLMCENNCLIQSRDTRITNLITVLNNYHISLTLLTLKKTYDILLNHISSKEPLHDYSDFKGHFSNEECSLLGPLLSPIKESLQRVIQSQIVVNRGVYHSFAKRDMWICAHYLQFLNKLNFKGIGLEDKALTEYLVAEQETSQLDMARCQAYIPAVRSILTDWLKDWDYDGNRPKHGPGSVADAKRSKLFKYYSLATDNRLQYLYKEDDMTVFPKWRAQAFQRVSRLVFVPKNITKLRSISMEPATLQYLQQGCMESLYNYFGDHPQLSKVLKLSDQFQNRSFAYHSSITNEYATIDLSHASDSVNWNLIKELFRKVPKLYKWLLCTRSTHTLLPTGETIELTKFAPMGSALCFPIESLVFAAIAKLSIELSRELALDRDNYTGIRSNTRFLTVYGDDIILPHYAASTCIELLKVFGFTPNEEKSYLTGAFKESCGGNYFCGLDITPIKYSPKLDVSFPNGISPKAYTALCSYANHAYSRGLMMFRLYCIKSIFNAGLMPLFTDKLDVSPAIISKQPTNFHLKRKYNKRYQKYQYLYTGTKAVEKAEHHFEDLDEEIFLFDKLLDMSKRKEECHLPLINANIKDGCVEFDIRAPYSRATLFEQTSKYTLCLKDV